MRLHEENFKNERGQIVSKATLVHDILDPTIEGLTNNIINAFTLDGMDAIQPGVHEGYSAALEGKDQYDMGTGRAVARTKAFLKYRQQQNRNIDTAIAYLENKIEELKTLRKDNQKTIRAYEKRLHNYRQANRE